MVAALLTNEVEHLKLDVGRGEALLEEQNDIMEKYWRCLASMGIDTETDAKDGFPDLDTHYAPKKKKQSGRSAPKNPAARAPARLSSVGGAESEKSRVAKWSRSTAAVGRQHDESDDVGDVEVIAIDSEEEETKSGEALGCVKAEWAAASSPAGVFASRGARPRLSRASGPRF